MPNSLANPVFSHTFTIPPEAIDGNGHANNVYYVQWMQDIAVRHYEFIGGVPVTQAFGATWVVHSHHIVYSRPAFAGEEVEVRTWVVNVRRAISLRRYEFIRKADGQQLVTGETDWVFVSAATGRPIAIPDEVRNLFTLLPDKRVGE